jgi:hypothetical protein
VPVPRRLIRLGAPWSTACVGTVGREVEPRHSGAIQACCTAAMPAMRAALAAIGLLTNVGVYHWRRSRGLAQAPGGHPEDGSLVECDHVPCPGDPMCPGPVVIPAVAAQMPKRGLTWEHTQPSAERGKNLALRLRGWRQPGRTLGSRRRAFLHARRRAQVPPAPRRPYTATFQTTLPKVSKLVLF